MTDVRPLHPVEQPPVEDLRNALMIAQSWVECIGTGRVRGNTGEANAAFRDVARLIRHALAQLGEPNEAAIQAVVPFLAPELEDELVGREARDCAAAAIKAQLTGVGK